MSLLGYLEDRNQALSDKAARNPDLAKTFHGIITHLVTICNNTGCALRDVGFGTVSINNRKLKVKILFHGGGYEPPLHHWATDWMRRKNLRVRKAMEENPRVHNLFVRIVSAIENYAEAKGIRYENVKIESAIIDLQDNLVLELNR